MKIPEWLKTVAATVLFFYFFFGLLSVIHDREEDEAHINIIYRTDK